MHVNHIGAHFAGAIQEKTHPRQPADGRVLAAGIEDVDVNRIAPHGDRGHFDHRVRTDAGIVARILAEGAFFAHILRVGIQHTFDDNLCARRHFQIHGLRGHNLQRLL